MMSDHFLPTGREVHFRSDVVNPPWRLYTAARKEERFSYYDEELCLSSYCKTKNCRLTQLRRSPKESQTMAPSACFEHSLVQRGD